MVFTAAYASRLTTLRLAPGALTTTISLAYASSERGTALASQQATTAASRHLVTMVTTRTSTIATATTSSMKSTVSRFPPRTTPPQRFMSSTTKKSGGGFVEWYEGHLQNHPIPTKMVTGSILWSLGDAVAQTMPPAAAGTFDLDTFQYDWMRTGRAFAFGFILHAPASHAHFNLLEWMTVRAGVTGMKIPIFKAFMEQFVYWSWISNSMYHAAMGYMQGQDTTQVIDKINSVLWETQKAQWVFWIPIQLLNFQFVPVRHQLNVVLITSVVWTAMLSAWYPPEVATEEKTPSTVSEQNQLKRRLSLITQQSGGGPADATK